MQPPITRVGSAVMARLLWLADVLRAAGLTVHEEPGWQTRGGDTFTPRGLVCHATGSARTSTARADINTIAYTGSATAPAPIAQLYEARNGDWHVIASGRCNHVLTGWAGPFQGLGNTNLLGVEAANNNSLDDPEPWPYVQYESYVRGVAAIVRHTGWPPPAGHKEHQPAGYGQPSIKRDPSFPMDPFRARVRALLDGDNDMTPEEFAWIKALGLRLDALIRGVDVVQDDPSGRPYPLPIVGQLRELRADMAGLKTAFALLASKGTDAGDAVILVEVQRLAAALADLADEVAKRDATIAELRTTADALRAEVAAARQAAEANLSPAERDALNAGDAPVNG